MTRFQGLLAAGNAEEAEPHFFSSPPTATEAATEAAAEGAKFSEITSTQAVLSGAYVLFCSWVLLSQNANFSAYIVVDF